jgi:site-specific DNA recombinase
VAAAYLRRSTPGQHHSLDSQDAAARAYAARRNLHLPEELIIRDTASGTRSDRDGFWRLLAAVDTGRVQVLLAWDLFRAGSNDLDAALLALACKENGVRIEIVSTGGQYLLDNPDSKLQYRIMMALADYRRENFLLTSDRGKGHLAPEGYWVGGAAPPGYEIAGGRGKKKLIANGHAGAVRRAFELYASGASTIKVAAWLRDHNIPSRTWTDPRTGAPPPRRWNYMTVSRLLDCPIYVGYIPFRGSLYKGLHEPIVSRDLWDRVQERRQAMRERCPGRPRGARPKAPAEDPATALVARARAAEQRVAALEAELARLRGPTRD